MLPHAAHRLHALCQQRTACHYQVECSHNAVETTEGGMRVDSGASDGGREIRAGTGSEKCLRDLLGMSTRREASGGAALEPSAGQGPIWAKQASRGRQRHQRRRYLSAAVPCYTCGVARDQCTAHMAITYTTLCSYKQAWALLPGGKPVIWQPALVCSASLPINAHAYKGMGMSGRPGGRDGWSWRPGEILEGIVTG